MNLMNRVQVVSLGLVFFQAVVGLNFYEGRVFAAGAASQEVQALIEKAAQFRSMGRTSEAIQAYQDAGRMDPANPIIHRNLGVLYFESDDLNQAEAALKESLGLANDDPYTYLYLARIAMKENENQNAQFYFQKALAVNPRLEEAHLYYGLFLTKGNQFEAAGNEYEIARSLAPRDPRPYVGLGNLHYHTQNYQAAVQAFETALNVDPNNVEAHDGLGATYFQAGDLRRSQRAFEEALAINPQDSTALNNLGVLLEKEGRFDEAERAFNRALSVDPSNDQARDNLNQLSSAERQRNFGGFPSEGLGQNMPGRDPYSRGLQTASFPMFSQGASFPGQSMQQNVQPQGSNALMQVGGAMLTQFLVNKFTRKKDS